MEPEDYKRGINWKSPLQQAKEKAWEENPHLIPPAIKQKLDSKRVSLQSLITDMSFIIEGTEKEPYTKQENAIVMILSVMTENEKKDLLNRLKNMLYGL